MDTPPLPGTIGHFYQQHGLEGLRRLAAGARTDLSYIRALLYSPSKNPSLKMALDLVAASNNELTFEGLAYPNGRDAEASIAATTAKILATA